MSTERIERIRAEEARVGDRIKPPEGRAGLSARLRRKEAGHMELSDGLGADPCCQGCGCELAAGETRYCADCVHDGVQSDADALRAFDAFHRFADGL